jgi:hypothetical protein
VPVAGLLLRDSEREFAIKGPGLRLDLDVRRVWQCPQCGRERKAGGEVTALRCRCTADGVLMRLVHEPRSGRGNRPHPPDVHVPPDATDIPPPPGLHPAQLPDRDAPAPDFASD